MAEYIDRKAAIDTYCILRCRSTRDPEICRNCDEPILAIPAADVVEREKYDELLKSAKKMHLWIFLNSGDEQKAYDECGLTDEQNELLGYLGGFELSEERKCGEWHDHYQIDSEYYVVTCSVCGCTSSFTDAWLPSYCPNCGAEMKGAREDA